MIQCFFYDCDLRNNAGFCKVTACINPKYNSVTNTADGYISAKYKPPVKKTNADRIRSMTDEELALWIAKISDCGECNVCGHVKCMTSEDSCACAWHDWLKQEAE